MYYYNARWCDPETGRFITEDSIIDPNNQGNAYVYVANNPMNNIDPTGNFNVSVAKGMALVSASINVLSAIDPNAGKALSAFNTLISVCSAFKYVEDSYLNNVVKNYTKTSSWSSKTDIPGVSYSETSTKTVVDGKSQSNTLSQKFLNKDKNVSIEINTTTTADGKTTQSYTKRTADEVKVVPLDYGKDGVADIIGMEGFTSDPTFGAIMIATTQKDGAVFALAGSTLPNDQSRFATIVDTDTYGRPYEMTYTTHKNLPALALEGRGKTDTLYDNPNDESDYFRQKYADGILIHYGWDNDWRGSQGCQTIKPGSDVARDKPNFTGYHDYMDFIHSITSGRAKEGAFVGYYYLETIVSRMPSTTTN